MLTLTAAQARRVRAALRPAAALRPRGQPPPVAFEPAGGGTVARLDAGEVVVQLALPDVPTTEPLAVPWAVVAAAAEFTAARRGAGVEVRRADGGRERVELLPSAPVRPAPALPAEWADNPPELLAAVAAAAGVTADHPGRYALHRVQLRGGRRGEVVATDGAALLVWGGFELPWPGDALVPAVKLAADGKPAAVRAGRTDAHVVLAAGGLTAWLAPDPAGRYPDPASVVPTEGAVRAWCRLDAADLKGLPVALDRLPGGDADPVTLELGRRAVLWAAGGGGPAEVLADAVVDGGPARVAFARGHLKRAARLGLGEVGVLGPGKPVLARDASRTLVWVGLDPADAVEREEATPTPAAAELSHAGRLQRRAAVRPATPAPVPPAETSRRRPTGAAGLLDGLLAGVGWLGRLARVARGSGPGG